MAGRKSRNKGYRGEHSIEKILNEKGINAKRIPLSGSDKFFKGDIFIQEINECCEVKVRKKLNDLFYQVLEKSNIGFLKQDRKDYFVVMRLDYFVNLIKQGGRK